MTSIRKAFISRFQPGGMLIEADFKQLEIFILACLSEDKHLIEDLRNGVDIHAENAKALFGVGFTQQQRTYAKQMSFQLQYGSGYQAMANKLDLPEEICKQFINVYYKRYPGVREYQNGRIKLVNSNRKPSGYRTNSGIPAGISRYQTATGRLYTFIESDIPWAPGETNFKPTEVKNYEVQGTATGDIVPHMLGRLFRELYKLPRETRRKLLLVNTVHDSILFDAHPDCIETGKELCYNVLNNTRQEVENRFGINLSLDLKVDIKVGPNWHNMEKVEL